MVTYYCLVFDNFHDPISLHVVSEYHHGATQSAFPNLNVHIHGPCILGFGDLDRGVVVVFDNPFGKWWLVYPLFSVTSVDFGGCSSRYLRECCSDWLQSTRKVEGDTGSVVTPAPQWAKELPLRRGDLQVLAGDLRYGQSSPEVREGAGVDYLLLLAA